MRRQLGMGALLVSLLAAACDDPIVVVSDGDLMVTSAADGFRVYNGSDAFDAVSVIIELETSALIDLAPCESWVPRLAPGTEQLLAYDDVIGYTEGADSAVVYWCMLGEDEPVDGGSLWLAFP